MNKIVLVLYILKADKQIEVIFDDRLSFIENLFLLNDIYNLDNIKEIHILVNNSFLKKDIPIKEFNLRQFEKLYIF